MTFSSLAFLVEEAAKSIRRNALMSLAALSSVTVALTVFGGSVFALYRLHQFVAAQPARFEISVFLRPNATREEVLRAKSEIEHLPGVRSVRLVPKEAALKELMEQDERRGTEVVKALAGANPLPDRFDVRPTAPEHARKVAALLRDSKRFPQVEYVRDEGELLDKLLATARLVRRVGGTLAVLLLFATGVIIHNTLRLTVLARKNEISIMKLVGASPSFIQFPLILEGIFYGVAGAVLAAVAVLFIVAQTSRYVGAFQTPLALGMPPAPGPLTVVVGLLLAGFVMGVVTSLISIRRFLAP